MFNLIEILEIRRRGSVGFLKSTDEKIVGEMEMLLRVQFGFEFEQELEELMLSPLTLVLKHGN